MEEMAEIAPTAAPAPLKAARTTKKKSATKPKKAGPSVSDLIIKAVSASKECSGVSLAALKKALAAGGYDVEKNNSRFNMAVKSLVSKETLLQTKGVGASGSFKLNKKVAEAKDKAAKKNTAVKKAAPKKAPAKKPATKKAVTKSPKKAKKPAAKKAAKSPKKAKKPAAKTEAKSPKKAKKPAAKKPAKSPKKAAKAKVVKTKRAAPKRR